MVYTILIYDFHQLLSCLIRCRLRPTDRVTLTSQSTRISAAVGVALPDREARTVLSVDQCERIAAHTVGRSSR